MDSQLIRYLLSAVQEAAAELKLTEQEKQFLKKAEQVKDAVPDTAAGKHGQIKEWRKDYREAEPGHRHISHLWGLHPGDEISPLNTPQLAEAARVTLQRRLEHGGGHTGWSRAWIINFWARLFASEKAYVNVRQLLIQSTMDNLLDNHPPFQIDGNFGGTAGIAEMLLQSHNEEIHILPALPQAWPSGSISGLCARGGFEVSISWEQGQLRAAEIKSSSKTDCMIRYKQQTIQKKFKAGEKYTVCKNSF